MRIEGQKELGERIKQARELAELTQKQVVFALDCSTQQPTRWEKGVQAPSALAVAAMASLFDVDPGWLLTGKGQPRAPAHGVDPAVAAWVELAKKTAVAPTEAEVEALKHVRAPKGRRLTPPAVAWIWEALRDLPPALEGPSRPSMAAASQGLDRDRLGGSES